MKDGYNGLNEMCFYSTFFLLPLNMSLNKSFIRLFWFVNENSSSSIPLFWCPRGTNRVIRGSIGMFTSSFPCLSKWLSCYSIKNWCSKSFILSLLFLSWSSKNFSLCSSSLVIFFNDFSSSFKLLRSFLISLNLRSIFLSCDFSCFTSFYILLS